jgi:hypothetical protein
MSEVEAHKIIAHNYRYEISMNWEDYAKAGA